MSALQVLQQANQYLEDKVMAFLMAYSRRPPVADFRKITDERLRARQVMWYHDQYVDVSTSSTNSWEDASHVHGTIQHVINLGSTEKPLWVVQMYRAGRQFTVMLSRIVAITWRAGDGQA